MKPLIQLFVTLLFTQYNAFSQNLTEIKFTVEKATEWNNLFQRNEGWFGGDGIYSIPLNGKEHNLSKGKTLFIFSDSMIGRITNNKSEEGSKMINNAVAILEKKQPRKQNLKFHWATAVDQVAKSIFIPKTPMTNPTDYYWLGDGFVNQDLQNAIFIFGYRIKQVSGGTFGFKEVGNTLIKIEANEKPPFKNYTQTDTPFYLDNINGETGSFGAGIYVNTIKSGAINPDEFIYVYGVLGSTKKLLVARVKPKDFEDFSKWNYWDGNNWQMDIHKSYPVTDEVSNELSVSALPDGRYAMIFQQSGISNKVAMRIGKTPYGPFGPIIDIWDCSDDLEYKSYFAYNAKAHPSLSKKGELLISYNINSFNFFRDLGINPHLYRPRFINVKFD